MPLNKNGDFVIDDKPINAKDDKEYMEKLRELIEHIRKEN